MRRLLLLDTNVVSELAKLRPAPPVLAWVRGQQPRDLFLRGIDPDHLVHRITDETEHQECDQRDCGHYEQ